MKITKYQYKNNNWQSELSPASFSENDLAILFASPFFKPDSEVIKNLQATFQKNIIIGCSTAGEIFGSSINDESLSLVVLSFKETKLKSAQCKINNAEDSRSSGRSLAYDLEGENLKAVFILSEGININGTDLLKGLRDVLPENVIITGGLAGDGPRFESTWVLGNEIAGANYVVAVGFYGNKISIKHGSEGGWDTFGPARLITKSKGNILYELDGSPALTLYKDYLGKRASGLPATALLFPMSIGNQKDSHSSLVRTILSVNEEEMSLTFAGDMPTGEYATFMRANSDRLVNGSATAARKAKQETDEDILCLAVSCVGRRLVMGERTEEEIEALMENLPPQTNVIGFYSYGEISPSKKNIAELHNQTMTLTTISEL